MLQDHVCKFSIVNPNVVVNVHVTPFLIRERKGPIFILFSSKLPRKKSLQCSTRLIPENNLRSLIRKKRMQEISYKIKRIKKNRI
jgi:hypothetical protein